MKILKKNKSRILGVLLSCVMTLSLLVGIGTVNVNADNGYTLENGVLTISSDTGMNNWASYISGLWGEECKNVTSVIIKSGVKYIKGSAFYNCIRLESVEIPDTVLTIEETAFALCKNLKSIIIPSSVLEIQYKAFANCTNLNTVLMKGESPATLQRHVAENWQSENNDVFLYSGCTLNGNKGIKVPSSSFDDYGSAWEQWQSYISTYVPHQHSWTYTENGNEIKAYCSNKVMTVADECDFQGVDNALTLTLTANNMTYSGNPYNQATKTENISTVTGASLIIQYIGRDGTVYNESETAPTNVGKYTAIVSVGGATATADFEITKINPTYTAPTTNDITYNGSNQELITKGSSNNGTMKYSLDQTNWSTDIPTGKDAGNYTVYYKVFGSGNYGDSSVESVTAKINPKAVTVTPDDVSKSYSDKDPQLTYKVTGLIDSESLKDITLTRKKGEEVGEYAITASQKEGSNSNYAITFNDGKLTINQKNIKNDENIEVKLGDTLIYDGKEQVQKIESVKINGKDVTYTVTGNKATEPGIYEMTIKGTGSYTGEFKFKYAVVSLDDTKTDNTFSGNIKTEVKRDDHAPKTELKTTKSEMIQLLASADELSKVANGDVLDIWLEVRDASDLISDTSKQQIAQKIEGYQIGQYIDISLFKQLRSASASTQITDTQKPIIIDVVITEDLLNNNTSIKRTYYIVRNHEGTVEILETTQNGNTLTFSTNQFSDYAIVYKDVQTNVATKGNKQTGDSTHISLYAMTLFSSFIGLAVLGFLKRKDMIER